MNKSTAIATTVGCWAVITATLFSLFSKEQNKSKTIKDGLEFGVFASSMGTAITESNHLINFSSWIFSKTTDLVKSAGNAAIDVINSFRKK